ncbi:hypothetical protein EDB19DRAFT_1916485 [Suillus lakei]|nr:hypothetical protein EDB19DRAFT_1916485 [Suillus lakei]
MSETPPTQGVRNAKKNTLKNAVWLPEKMCTKRQQHDTASSQCEPQWGSQLQLQPKSTKKRKMAEREDKVVTKRQSPDMPGSQGEPQWGSQPQSQSKPKSTKKHYCTASPAASDDKDEAMKRKRLWLDAKKSSGHTAQQLTSIKEDWLEQSRSEEAGNHTNSNQTDFASDVKDSSDDSDFEDPTSVAKMLLTEIPSFVTSSKVKNPPVSTSSQYHELITAETPVWANDLMSIGHSEASSMANSQAKSKQPLTKAHIMKAESEQDFSDAEDKSDTSSVTGSRSSLCPSGSSSAKLILTEHGKVKMMDQDITTRKVIQGAVVNILPAALQSIISPC